MKLLLSTVLFLSCAFATAAAVLPSPAPPPAPATELVIDSQGGVRYSQTNVVWLRQVRAAENDFYVECEKLTGFFNTNSVRTNITGGASVPATNSPAARFDRVIAETNVMIITGDSQVIGDYAVYYASNDTLYVTGDMVIAANPQGSIVCTNITFDRGTGSSWVEGPNTFIGTGSAFSRTNGPSRKTNAPPARP